MMLNDIFAALVVILVLGGAVFYIVKSKKNGKKCIGCPGGCCTGSCQGCGTK